MSSRHPLRLVVQMLVGCIVLCIPLVRSDGQLLIFSVLSAVAVYEGASSRVVYGSLAFLLVSEVLYGGEIGVASIAYAGTIVLYMGVRRFVALHPWAHQDGWGFSDAMRTLVAAWVFCASGLIGGIIIGNILYGHDFVAERMMQFIVYQRLLPPALVCAITLLVVRRMAIPFHREILFGV